VNRSEALPVHKAPRDKIGF